MIILFVWCGLSDLQLTVCWDHWGLVWTCCPSYRIGSCPPYSLGSVFVHHIGLREEASCFWPRITIITSLGHLVTSLFWFQGSCWEVQCCCVSLSSPGWSYSGKIARNDLDLWLELFFVKDIDGHYQIYWTHWHSFCLEKNVESPAAVP